jgi:hypothetical protein
VVTIRATGEDITRTFGNYARTCAGKGAMVAVTARGARNRRRREGVSQESVRSHTLGFTPEDRPMSGALAGIRVVDIHEQPGGAVVRADAGVARRGRDQGRGAGQGRPGAHDLQGSPDADSLFYLSFNGNKRS